MFILFWETANPKRGRCGRPAMFAAHYKLDNLCAVLDFNGLQIDGPITEVMNPTPLDEKFKAFGWHVRSTTDTTLIR